jgi:hypothetical protein
MSEDEAKTRNRSPNYPYISLSEAIEKTCVVLEKDKLNPTSPEVIAGHLDYAKLHGTSRRVLSAMREFGLLEEVTNKRLKVSNLGYKLCRNTAGEDERAKLLKEAALTPFIFRIVIEEFKGDLPSTATLVDYLVTNKKFSLDGAASLEKVLRETVEFAKITSADFEEKAAQDMEGKAERQKDSGSSDLFNFFSPKKPTPPQDERKEQKPLFKYSVPLSIQRDVNAHLVITGTSLKRRDLDVLAKKVGDLLDAFEEDEPEPEPQATEVAPAKFEFKTMKDEEGYGDVTGATDKPPIT